MKIFKITYILKENTLTTTLLLNNISEVPNNLPNEAIILKIK